MLNRATIAELIGLLNAESPSGFAIALHIRFTAPTFLFQSYPIEWTDKYTAEGLVMQDPTVAWGFSQTGAIRWSALEGADTAGVLERARAYGMEFGVTMALQPGELRSVASFARGDREYRDDEIAEIDRLFAQLHASTEGTEQLTADDIAALRAMSIRLTHN
jgi:LuxR family transcriptional regulator, quorum-sensing system regulator SdiA